MTTSNDIEGKTALVTGANRGIGMEIVESFLRHGAAKVYAAVRALGAATPLVRKHGRAVVPIQIDLDEPKTIVAAARTAQDVRIVVNNAGVLRVSSPLADDAIESLEIENRVNVFGLIRMAQSFAPVLRKNGGGAFVQLNSISSMKSFASFATYSASKAAAYSITQALRELLAQHGTAVLSVHAGPIATEMSQTAGLAEIAEPASVVAEGIVAALKAGDFHLFPDSTARQIWGAYQSFAENVIEADLQEV